MLYSTTKGKKVFFLISGKKKKYSAFKRYWKVAVLSTYQPRDLENHLGLEFALPFETAGKPMKYLNLKDRISASRDRHDLSTRRQNRGPGHPREIFPPTKPRAYPLRVLPDLPFRSTPAAPTPGCESLQRSLPNLNSRRALAFKMLCPA